MTKENNIVIYSLIAVIFALAVICGFLWTSNAKLKKQISIQSEIMANLFEQNATMTELVCAYAKVVGGPQPEICLEG